MLTIKPEDITALIDAFERCSSQEIRVAAAGFELHLSKSADGALRARGGRGESSPMRSAPSVEPAKASPGPGSSALQGPGESAPKAASPAKTGTPSLKPGQDYVRAANLGTFYRSPKPGAPAYVEVGTRVTPDTEVCLVEVMKLFTPIHAGVSGVVREVLVQDGQLVEFDQPLFVVELDT